MAVVIARGTLRRMREVRDQCVLRLRVADDTDAAFAALARLASIAFEVAGGARTPNFVSEVMATPHGPLVLMDAKDLTDDDLGLVLDRLYAEIAQGGVMSGVLEVPTGGELLEELTSVGEAVIGAAYLPTEKTSIPHAPLPDSWLTVAADWLRSASYEPLVVDSVGVEAPISWRDLDGYLRSQRGEFRVSCGSTDEGMRIAAGGTGMTRLALLACGTSLSLSDLAGHARVMRDHVARCTPAATYAYVAGVDSASMFGSGAHDLPWSPMGVFGHPGRGFRQMLSDLSVLDVFWWQLLGPGHIARLGEPPGAQLQASGMTEWSIGEFQEWLDPVQAEELRDPGRRQLEPCFLDDRQQREILRERRQRGERG